MSWAAVGVAAVGAVSSNIAANKVSNAAKSSSRAAKEAADAQVVAGQEASTLLDPFRDIGEQGLSQSGFLTDPNAQVDFLQSNPLFNLSLQNANQQTQKSAASRGRLSAGDTLQQLSNNVLLSASPLIANQKQSIGDLLNFGLTTASNQGNLRTGQGAATAGGIVGAQNALNQGVQADINNINSIGALAGGLIPSLVGRAPPPQQNFNQVGGQSPNAFTPFDPLAPRG